MWTVGLIQVGLCLEDGRKDNGTKVVEDVCMRVIKTLIGEEVKIERRAER